MNIMLATKRLRKFLVGAMASGVNIDVLTFALLYKSYSSIRKELRKKLKIKLDDFKTALRLAYDSIKLGLEEYEIDWNYVQNAIKYYRSIVKKHPRELKSIMGGIDGNKKKSYKFQVKKSVFKVA